MLRLVEAAMTCCDYTTDVDKPFKTAARRTHAQLKGVTSVLRGLVTACDYASGQVSFNNMVADVTLEAESTHSVLFPREETSEGRQLRRL
jgi:hypothetical protein